MNNYLDIGELTKEEVRFIRDEMDGGSSLRRLAEIFVDKFNKFSDMKGNQILGMALCQEANYDWQGGL